jgi:hypothetical protein
MTGTCSCALGRKTCEGALSCDNYEYTSAQLPEGEESGNRKMCIQDEAVNRKMEEGKKNIWCGLNLFSPLLGAYRTIALTLNTNI